MIVWDTENDRLFALSMEGPRTGRHEEITRARPLKLKLLLAGSRRWNQTPKTGRHEEITRTRPLSEAHNPMLLETTISRIQTVKPEAKNGSARGNNTETSSEAHIPMLLETTPIAGSKRWNFSDALVFSCCSDDDRIEWNWHRRLSNVPFATARFLPLQNASSFDLDWAFPGLTA